MKIGRTVPPAANTVAFRQLALGLKSVISGSDRTEAFKDGCRRYFSVKYVYPLCSGKAALALVLMALKRLSPGRPEVVIPAYTCFSVPSAILKAGLQIVPCEIEPESLDFDRVSLEKAVNEKTLAVVPTHFFGAPAEMAPVLDVARKNGAYVVEDAAQAMGVRLSGRMLGTFADAGFFSLGRGKNITCGSGGLLVTDSEEIADAVDAVYKNLEAPGPMEGFAEVLKVAAMDIFIRPSLYWFPLGIPSLRLGETIFYRDFPVRKLSAAGAAIMKGWVERLEALDTVRKSNAQYYIKKLDLPVRQDIPFLRLPLLMAKRDIRDEFYRRARRFGASLMYPCPVNEIPEIRSLFRDRTMRGAKEAADRLVFLPTHALVKKRDMEMICEIYRSVAAASGGAEEYEGVAGASEARNYN